MEYDVLMAGAYQADPRHGNQQRLAVPTVPCRLLLERRLIRLPSLHDGHTFIRDGFVL